MPTSTHAIAALLEQVARSNNRVLLGIAGAPGAGKSTVTAQLLEAATAQGISAVGVSMDGWHLAHSVLEKQGLVAVKGSPQTFDAHGFVDTVKRIRAQESAPIWVPEFRREIEDAIASAIEVPASAQLVILEGNYLLLKAEPWAELRALFDHTWFVAPDESLRQERLIARHVAYGRNADDARAHALGSDENNAEFIRTSSDLAGTTMVDPS